MDSSAALLLAAASERRIVKAFRTGHALSGTSARHLKDLGLKDSAALKGLIVGTVIRKAGPDRYFLDERLWASRRDLEWRTVLRVVVVLGLVAAAALILIRR